MSRSSYRGGKKEHAGVLHQEQRSVQDCRRVPGLFIRPPGACYVHQDDADPWGDNHQPPECIQCAGRVRCLRQGDLWTHVHLDCQENQRSHLQGQGVLIISFISDSSLLELVEGETLNKQTNKQTNKVKI